MISALDAVAFGNDSSPLTAANDTAGGAAQPSNDTASVIQFLDDDLSFPDYLRNTCMVVCVIILGVGVVGNMMVPIVILKSKDMRNSTNIFLMNLSIADLMVLLICTPTVFVEVNSRPETWVLGEELCESHSSYLITAVVHYNIIKLFSVTNFYHLRGRRAVGTWCAEKVLNMHHALMRLKKYKYPCSNNVRLYFYFLTFQVL